MYLQHFRLKLMPFEIRPGPKFLWLGSKYKETFAVLRFGAMEGRGWVVLTGEPGMGKSTLLSATIATFRKSIRFAKIGEAALNEMGFLKFAAHTLELNRSFEKKSKFLVELEKYIQTCDSQRVVLVIDDAQRLTPHVLEQIRVFSDAADQNQKAFNCIFAGRPNFSDMIWKSQAQNPRIVLSHTLEPLTQPETGEYIAHRLKVGGREDPIFTPEAVQEVHRLSGGTPRLINYLCDQALSAGCASNLTTIGPELIWKGAERALIARRRSNQMPATATPDPSTRAPAGQAVGSKRMEAGHRIMRTYLPIVAAVFVVAISALLYRTSGFNSVSPPFYENDSRHGKSATEDETASPDNGSSQVQVQDADLRRRNDPADEQLKELAVIVQRLEGELAELRPARDRAIGLEKIIASQEAYIAELRQMLNIANLNAARAFEEELETINSQNAELRALLADITRRKNDAEARLIRERQLNAMLAGEMEAHNRTLDRGAQPEEKLASLELGKSTAMERDANDTAVQRSRSDKLSPIQESRVIVPPATVRVQTSYPASLDKVEPGPDPAGVIDYVVKKKFQ